MPKQSISPAHALLGLLSQGERHGYELKRLIDTEFTPYWRIDFAQLYRSLAKMSRAGWVKARTEPGKGGMGRKVYSLTARGRQVLEGWLAEATQNRNEFFVKARLAQEYGAPIRPLVEAQRRIFEAERDKHAAAHQSAQNAGDPNRLVITQAALGDSEASLAVLELINASVPSARRNKTFALPQSLIITGSDDPLLARLAEFLHASTHPVGSIGGLLALAQHRADIAGIHLLDADTGEYNVPFVKHLLPEDDIVLVNLALRENGLIIARGNPKGIRGVRDLTRRGIRFVNRAYGTGTRLLLFCKLRAGHINPHDIDNWNHTVGTHDAIAAAIATGAADVGPGLCATATAWNLDFIPLGEEQYDLAIPRAELESARVESLLSTLHSKDLRRLAEKLAGYDLAHAGKVVARVK